MMQNKCGDTKTSFGQLKFPLHIPNDPRMKCRGCGPSSASQNGQKKALKRRVRPQTKTVYPSNLNAVAENISSSESGLSFLPIGNNENMDSRPVRYQDYTGTSFGAHLLRKSVPLIAQGLDHKLKFKRDSDAAKIIMHQQRKIPQPFFIEQVDSEELAHAPEPGTETCPPHRPMKKNFFHNQFLTTGNRAKEGLKYVMATNFPHLPPDPLADSSPIQHEIKDECGRKTHHLKLRARDLGKRLCEAPSMTKELDDLYKEYIQRCPEGNELADACRALHHAPSPHHREPRRSILKDTSSGHEIQAPQPRRSSLKSQLVRFDKDVDLISTAITKVNGMDASLRETDGRLKLLRQLGGRITATRLLPEKAQEKYPLHVRDPKRIKPTTIPQEWMKKSDLEDLEERTAKQDLARIYFTTEATKLIACTNLPSLDRNTNTFKKSNMFRRPSFPHFFLDRLESEMEMETRKKQEDRLAAIKNEMDAFDESLKRQPPLSLLAAKFDPLQTPSEKSLNDLKLKVEIMKRQKERDVQSAADRARTRRSYFRKMLPCFPDVIKNDLLDYSIKQASKLCGEEMILASDFLLVAHQRDIFAEHRRFYDEEEEYLTEEGEEEAGENEKMIRDILDVCVDVVVKISNYKTTTGNEPPESLQREWRDAGFALLNQQDAAGEDKSEEAPEIVCGGEGTSEEDTSQSQMRRISDLTNDTQDEMKDASLSQRDDGDETHTRCIVTISTVKEPSEARPSIDGKVAPKVQVKVTDCLHEDLESALTYDGLYLPVSDSQLTQSSSESQSDSSGSPSGSPTDSPGESVTDCLNVPRESSKQQIGEMEYEEYAGEDEEYFDVNGDVIIRVPTHSLGGAGSLGRIEGELTEETATELDEGARVGEVEVQAIDYSEGDSPEGRKTKGKGLQFNEVIDKRASSEGEYAPKDKSGADSKVSLKDSIKFRLPQNFESKRNPVIRKKTAFRHRESLDDDMDDDDDYDEDGVSDNSGLNSEKTRSSSGGDEEGIEGEENANEMDEEGVDDDGRSSKRSSTSRGRTPCVGPSQRKPLVYAELGKITYGMNSPEHENKFLVHRHKDLKQFSEAWEKGLYKPPNVFTKREKNFVPYSNQYTGKRLPPFNILDPYIPRPKFNLRIKKLIRMIEQAKQDKEICKEEEEATRQEIQEETNNRSQTFVVAESLKPTCSEQFKDKRRPNWQKEIAEYECRRKEREKLLAEKENANEDYVKSLGFEAFYNESTLRQTFIRQGHGHVQILDDGNDREEEHDTNYDKKSSLIRKKTMACVPGPDGALPDVCEVADDEAENQEGGEEVEGEEEDICQQYMSKYLEYPGEGYYEDNLEFQCEVNQELVNEDMFSIQETYNE